MKTPYWWYEKHSWQANLLRPLGYLTAAIADLRWQKHVKGLMQVWYSPILTIVVGNITIGGTGKTPMVLLLSRLLKEQGFRPVIVSKGYKGSHTKQSKRVHLVSVEDSASLVGDEPLLMSCANFAPVLIGCDRIQAIAIAQRELNADCVICDDGLQDFHFHHDIEVCMLDGLRQLGNGLCLPAGPLREAASRLNNLDLIVENSHDGRQRFEQANGIMHLKAEVAINLLDGSQKPLSWFNNQSALAIAGIGNPERFFYQLSEKISDLESLAFADHHAFQMQDLPANRPVLMTTKDAVKCREFSADNYWEVPVETSVSEQFVIQFNRLFKRKYNKRLRSKNASA